MSSYSFTLAAAVVQEIETWSFVFSELSLESYVLWGRWDFC